MRITLQRDQVVLEGLNSLRSHHRSQLSFWGFRRTVPTNADSLAAQMSDPGLLVRLVDYLGTEGIEFSLSSDIDQVVGDELRRLDDFRQLRDMAARYKDGRLRGSQFDAFRFFVESHIIRKLKPHQFNAALHHYLLGNAANFSVPGSGKTTVVLTVYEKLRMEGRVNALFVIGPPSCFGPWRTEFKDTLGRIPVAKSLAGGDAAFRRMAYDRQPSSSDELYLTTFQSLCNDVSDVKRWFLMRGVDVFLVVDEAHYMKQQNGYWAKALLDVAPHAAFRCALTGTPMPNSFTDVFNIFDCLWGKDQVLSAESKVEIVVMSERGDTERSREILKSDVAPFFYRVRKSDLNLQPQVFQPPCELGMNRIEERIYHAITARIREFTQQDYLRNAEILRRLRRGRLMRLRQCVSNIKMLQSAIDGYDENLVDTDSELYNLITKYETLEKPSKLLFLTSYVAEFAQKFEKVVIWSNFVSTIDLIASELNKRGLRCKCILGRTPRSQGEYEGDSLNDILDSETREAICREFLDRDSGMDVLVANPSACAESISLHKSCHHAIYYDLSYNCAQYLQSLDRIHRVGGSEEHPAYYHFLQYKDTIDQDIRSSLDRKAQRMYQLIDDDYAVYSLNMFEDDELEEQQAYERLFGEQ